MPLSGPMVLGAVRAQSEREFLPRRADGLTRRGLGEEQRGSGRVGSRIQFSSRQGQCHPSLGQAPATQEVRPTDQRRVSDCRRNLTEGRVSFR